MTYPALDASLSYAAQSEAIRRASEHATANWKREALEAVRFVALHSPVVTSDEIFEELSVLGVATHENRAMGPIMLQAKREGWIEPTDRFTPTRKISQHAQPIRIWRSLVYAPVAPAPGEAMPL